MNEPSITCISCNRTSYNPIDVAEQYCGNCHANTHGSIIWTVNERQPKIITGSVGGAPIFRIDPSARPHHFQLGVAPLISIIYQANGRYDVVPHALDTVGRAKDTAAILMARLVRLMWLTQPSLGTSGGVPVTDELVQHLADRAEAGYDEAQLVPRNLRTSNQEGED